MPYFCARESNAEGRVGPMSLVPVLSQEEMRLAQIPNDLFLPKDE